MGNGVRRRRRRPLVSWDIPGALESLDRVDGESAWHCVCVCVCVVYVCVGRVCVCVVCVCRMCVGMCICVCMCARSR